MKRTMKTWKRWMLAIVSCVLALSLAACSSDKDPEATSATTTAPTTSAPETTEQTETPNLDGSLQDILKQIYETADVSDDDRSWFLSSMATIDITEENMSFYIGVQSADVEEGIASEPMISSIAYSLCLLRVKPGTDIEQLKADIKANVNPRKWVCVEVSQDNVLVENIGDVILLAMNDTHAHALCDAFLALK